MTSNRSDFYLQCCAGLDTAARAQAPTIYRSKQPSPLHNPELDQKPQIQLLIRSGRMIRFRHVVGLFCVRLDWRPAFKRPNSPHLSFIHFTPLLLPPSFFLLPISYFSLLSTYLYLHAAIYS